MNSLGIALRRYGEMLAGRIVKRSITGRFLDQAGQRRRVRPDLEAYRDADGREWAYFKGTGVHCGNGKWRGLHPFVILGEHGSFRVPFEECKRCEFHEPPRHGRRFPCCRWDRENAKLPTQAQLIAGAVRQAKDLLGGK